MQSPIGIFDSGVGGLTVARAILDQLPDESIYYVGDTARGPYGPLPLAQVREVDLEAFAHADVPFEAVVSAVDPVRSEAFSPLFQVMLLVNEAVNVDADENGDGIDIGGLRVSTADGGVVAAQVDLTVALNVSPAGWRGRARSA